MIYELMRLSNRVNPTSYGTGTLAWFAHKYGSKPAERSYRIAPGVVMRLNASEYIERAILLHSFERVVQRELLKHVRPGCVFLDIGANVGYYSLLACAKLRGRGRVIAFEPNPRMIMRLRENIELSSASEIDVLEVALSNYAGTAHLFSPGAGNQGEASLVNQGWNEFERLRVPVRRLDDCLPPGLERVDVVKIDVEGAEMMVIQGAERTIKLYGPAVLLEINERASRSFGFGPLDATEMLLRLRPDYTIYQITAHAVRRTSFAYLKASGVGNYSLLLVRCAR